MVEAAKRGNVHVVKPLLERHDLEGAAGEALVAAAGSGACGRWCSPEATVEALLTAATRHDFT